jgi:hypothetical protein
MHSLIFVFTYFYFIIYHYLFFFSNSATTHLHTYDGNRNDEQLVLRMRLVGYCDQPTDNKGKGRRDSEGRRKRGDERDSRRVRMYAFFVFFLLY